jgi:hemoglobin-like flavoprotein
MGDAVTLSFELAANRCEDLTSLVYERLFREHPEMEPLFLLDGDGAVRGSMLSWSIRAILDFVGERDFGHNMIQAEAINHVRNGVAASDFPIFFRALASTIREIVGSDWTLEMDTAWRELLIALDATVNAVEPTDP